MYLVERACRIQVRAMAGGATRRGVAWHTKRRSRRVGFCNHSC